MQRFAKLKVGEKRAELESLFNDASTQEALLLTRDQIAAMEGMSWETPKGTMKFRAEDHQAMQSMYHFKIRVDDDVEWAIPELVRELTIDDLPIPVRNK